MSTSIPYLKKRKSFITITRKSNFCQQQAKIKPIRLDQLDLQSEWTSVVLNNTADAPTVLPEISKCATARPRQ